MKLFMMMNDGTYKWTEYKKIKPVYTKSCVDKTDFAPNTDDVKSCIKGMSGSVRDMMYEFPNGKDNGTSLAMLRMNPDITEVEEMQKNLQKKAQKNINTITEEIENEKTIAEMQKKAQQQAQQQNQQQTK